MIAIVNLRLQYIYYINLFSNISFKYTFDIISGGSDDGLWTSDDVIKDSEEFSDNSSDYKSLPLTSVATSEDTSNVSISDYKNCSTVDSSKFVALLCEGNIDDDELTNIGNHAELREFCKASPRQNRKSLEIDDTNQESLHKFPHTEGDSLKVTHEDHLLQKSYISDEKTRECKANNELLEIIEDYDNIASKENTNKKLSPNFSKRSNLVKKCSIKSNSLNTKESLQIPTCTESKSFLGRRCQSFNTFKSFLSSTKSHLKRTTSIRPSQLHLKSTLGVTDEDMTIPIKSIFKKQNIINKTDSKNQQSKHISFNEIVDVFPENITQLLNSGNDSSKNNFSVKMEIPSFASLKEKQKNNINDAILNASDYEISCDKYLTALEINVLASPLNKDEEISSKVSHWISEIPNDKSDTKYDSIIIRNSKYESNTCNIPELNITQLVENNANSLIVSDLAKTQKRCNSNESNTLDRQTLVEQQNPFECEAPASTTRSSTALLDALEIELAAVLRSLEIEEDTLQ